MTWDRLPARVAILSQVSARSDRVHEIARRMGWRAELIDPQNGQQDFSIARWDLIVVLADDVDTELLALISAVSLPTQTRTLVIASERDPQVVADVLRAGSDDYVPEPVEAEELAARMQSLVLRARDLTERRQDGKLTIDSSRRMISAGPWRISLSGREWDVLMILLDNAGTVISTQNIARKLDLQDPTGSHVPSIISRVRKKFRAMGFEAIHLETVHGRGYTARFRRASDSVDVQCGQKSSYG